MFDRQPIKIKQFTKVEQRAMDFVYMEAWEFIDGKKGGNCLTKSVKGILQNWNQYTVTVKDGDYYKTYNILGALDRMWRF